MKVLVTGAAGFIGHHVSRRLASADDCEVLGVDNLSDYYDVALKRARLAQLEPLARFRFLRADVADPPAFADLLKQFRPDYVVHLAAQPGVRYSIENPGAYVRHNLEGFASVLEACRRTPPKHCVYASSSSVYGSGARPPFREDDDTSQPLSFYGATKKCNEVMAHSHAHVHGLRLTGLRLFSVYGPWGRPDMAPTLFAKAIVEGRPLPLFNEGRNLRDFTYVDDIVAGVVRVLLYPPDAGDSARHAVYNIGHNRPVETVLFVEMLEQLLGRKAEAKLLPPQAGDMFETCADLTKVRAKFGYEPRVPLEEGLRRFVEWFREYYPAA
jgi:UDP-glucuronate 4-epimerase